MKLFYNCLFSLSILTGCFQSTPDISPYKDVNKFNQLADSLYVNFDISMQKERYKNKIKNYQPLFSFLKHQYEINNFKRVSTNPTPKIPKIFHYIWLGKKLPDQYKPFLDTWLNNHSDWTFIFYVDNPQNYNLGTLLSNFTFQDIAKYLQNITRRKRIVIDVKNLYFDNRRFFDETKNYGQRSDILKWEVVYRFGGVYIDIDIESIKPLDMLHHMYDFYTGLQPLDTNAVQLGAALFGARPHHPILKHCTESIKDDWIYKQIITSTGPIHFTKSLCKTIGHSNFVNIVLPASYLYPCGYEEQKIARSKWIRPESFAVHHWAGSWLKPEGFDTK